MAEKAMRPPADGNQCDGCRAGMPIRDGVHLERSRFGTKRNMVCQAGLYLRPWLYLPTVRRTWLCVNPNCGRYTFGVQVERCSRCGGKMY